jgi:hypothetical protein
MKIVIITAILVAGCAMHAAPAASAGTAAAPRDVPARWVFIDPETGAIQPVPPLTSLQMERSDGVPGTSPRLMVMPNGFELIDTRHLMHAQVVTRDADGHIEATCTDAGHLHPVRRNLGQDGDR